ncbi:MULTISPECIES: hypothetical protein [Sphingobacterium]|uniref:hypothetical protein n=1 Tax=Sphingobacterium TaxID=28453 RepID=UPI001627C17B|nr:MULTISPECIES: hypothetical protein [Sphingobacterium]
MKNEIITEYINVPTEINKEILKDYVNFETDDKEHVFQKISSISVPYIIGFDESDIILDDFNSIKIYDIIFKDNQEIRDLILGNILTLTAIYRQLLWEGKLSYYHDMNYDEYYLIDQVKRIDELIDLLLIKENLENAKLKITYSDNPNYKPKSVIDFPLKTNPLIFDKLAEELYNDWARTFNLNTANSNIKSEYLHELYFPTATSQSALYLTLKKGWKCEFSIESLNTLKEEVMAWKRNNKTKPYDKFLKETAKILYRFISDQSQTYHLNEKNKHLLIYNALLVGGNILHYKDFDFSHPFNDQKEDFVKALIR